tara:strand:+ start:781 stop:1197 length:417 start_codon:yes stop_codon:yes gene_type:complete
MKILILLVAVMSFMDVTAQTFQDSSEYNKIFTLLELPLEGQDTLPPIFLEVIYAEATGPEFRFFKSEFNPPFVTFSGMLSYPTSRTHYVVHDMGDNFLSLIEIYFDMYHNTVTVENVYPKVYINDPIVYHILNMKSNE